ncbi:SDR family NAD(P)-dependent oxidoreductase, partial [Salmonella enterica]|uniref:SDR family NAD(P)-dependent oxidoreductase n=1 Tax=Salmonella enterica TaxID=28901 RepID=UPI001111F1E8
NRMFLVTVASDGIGRDAAFTYALYGATVMRLGRNEEKLRRVAQHIADEHHVQPQWFPLDLLTCTAEECRQVADRTAAHYPRLDG